MYRACHILLITLSLLSSFVSAANWKAIEGYNAYVDVDSKKREGDIASINVRLTGSQYTYVTWDFDCVRWRVLDDKNSQLPPNTLGDEVAKIACKRKWEVWK